MALLKNNFFTGFSQAEPFLKDIFIGHILTKVGKIFVDFLFFYEKCYFIT